MVFSDDSGRIYDHPQLEMAGVDGGEPQPVRGEELIPLPRGSLEESIRLIRRQTDSLK